MTRFTSTWEIDGDTMTCTPTELFPTTDGRVIDVAAYTEPDGQITVHVHDLALDLETARAVARHILTLATEVEQ
ncbi:hypothetical protein [Brachybacterium sp. UMB0905]|uniref:hypothetical protein n=1 Tax=Brachybacterium sp. UMB0905 TaxID=2069310 RepID=UPI0011AF2D38|nr:hypothetical protein [Brachybacterium sp. UMB0905]